VVAFINRDQNPFPSNIVIRQPSPVKRTMVLVAGFGLGNRDLKTVVSTPSSLLPHSPQYSCLGIDRRQLGGVKRGLSQQKLLGSSCFLSNSFSSISRPAASYSITGSAFGQVDALDQPRPSTSSSSRSRVCRSPPDVACKIAKRRHARASLVPAI